MFGWCTAFAKALLVSHSIKAGRTPFELEQLLLFQLPLVFTFKALLELLVFGERSHQLVADNEPYPIAMRKCG